MAGGNLGDLWFQLGVKDNTSKELQKSSTSLRQETTLQTHFFVLSRDSEPRSPGSRSRQKSQRVCRCSQ